MLGLLFLAPIAAIPAADVVVPQEIRAEPASLAVATRGLVRDAVPRLGYDLVAAAAWRDGPRPAFRLAYASDDELRAAAETRDLLIAHALASEIVLLERAVIARTTDDRAP